MGTPSSRITSLRGLWLWQDLLEIGQAAPIGVIGNNVTFPLLPTQLGLPRAHMWPGGPDMIQPFPSPAASYLKNGLTWLGKMSRHV